MKIKEVPFDSKEYHLLCDLREKELRIPLGRKLSAADVLHENKQHHFGVFENSQAIACMVLVPKENGVLKMRQVCAHKDYQGQGIASKLLEHVEDWAQSKNYQTMECHARETAFSFYNKHGYQTKGEIFEEVGIPHYFMFKPLS